MKKYPHIKFIYSWPLDMAFASARKEEVSPEDIRKIKKRIPTLQNKWDKIEGKTWSFIKEKTETKPPSDKEINCYIVTYLSPVYSGIDHPLILESKRILEEFGCEYFFLALFHELLHQTIHGKDRVSEKCYQAKIQLEKLLPNLTISIRRHAILVPLQFQIGTKIFGEKYIQKLIKILKKRSPSWLRIFEIVDQITENILEDDIFEKINKLYEKKFGSKKLVK